MPLGSVTVIGGGPSSSVSFGGERDFGFTSGMIPFGLNLTFDRRTALACFDPEMTGRVEKKISRHYSVHDTTDTDIDKCNANMALHFQTT